MSPRQIRQDKLLRSRIKLALQEAHAQGLESVVVTLLKALQRLNKRTHS